MITVNLIKIKPIEALPVKAKTLPLSAQEIATIKGHSKKGAYNEARTVHIEPLPCNDLKVTIRGDLSPTFHFDFRVDFH